MQGFSRFASGTVVLAFGAVLVVAVFAIFIKNIVTSSVIGHALSIVLPAALCAALFIWKDSLLPGLARAFSPLDRLPPIRFLALCLLAGILIRLAVILFYWPMDYGLAWEETTMAGHLIHEGQYVQKAGEYFASETRAFWPPGRVIPGAYFIALLDNWYLGLWTYGALLFVIGFFGVYRLGLEVAGEMAARIAAVLFALWPGLIFFSVAVNKELALVAILPWAIVFYLRGCRAADRRWLWLTASGVAVALLSYVQPSFLLFPLVFVAYELCRAEKPHLIAGRAVLVVGVALASIAPWTYRNYQVLGAPVLISTNGGITLWVGNNPEATGDYDREAEFALDHLPELERSATLQRMAIDWILENPDRFARLVPNRVLLTLGSDRHGVYWAVQAKAGREGWAFEGPVLTANLFWLLVICAMLLPFLSAGRRRTLMRTPEALLLMLPLLYSLGIHSIVEGGDRHHVAAIAALAVLLGLMYGARETPHANS